MQNLNIKFEQAKRILVMGCSGSGKSTITHKLSTKYQLPAEHLDYYFWQPGWVSPDRDKWFEIVEKISDKDKWIIDGTFLSSLKYRLPRADIVVVVSLPRHICLYRAIKRVFTYSKIKRRPDMAEGCDEAFDLSF